MEIHIKPTDEMYKYVLPIINSKGPWHPEKLSLVDKLLVGESREVRFLRKLEDLNMIIISGKGYIPYKSEILQDGTLVLYNYE